MAKNLVNYYSGLKGMSPEEIADYYSRWAENMKYDQDLNPGTYNGPTIMADEVADCFPENRDKIKIIDIACGSGRVGNELAAYGFKNIDGLDPSDGMLKQCEHDCLVLSGGMGESHVPCSGILQMIRIVKPGGLVLISMRKEFLENVGEYADKLEPFFAKLERENQLEMVERRVVPNYSFNRDGVLFKIKVKNGV
ncbi:methyltransferase-like protein 27 [Mercenaria mercenaria]|uniref:methyltransferase-like protein 27 n=1 Tax=Mercenaria mercenaria TaxID=6596 RepID=UPI00234E7425|nr:methyltransferase-like protein 27 [Mercenaria mercenaria]